MSVHTHADGPGDHVVSFDAFKVSRYADHPRYRVEALVPWARAMLADPRALGVATSYRAIVLGSRDPDKLGKLPRIQFGYGLGFERRKDALSFLGEIESMAERWPA